MTLIRSRMSRIGHALDVNPDPFGAANQAALIIRTFQDIDIAVRHGASTGEKGEEPLWSDGGRQDVLRPRHRRHRHILTQSYP